MYLASSWIAVGLRQKPQKKMMQNIIILLMVFSLLFSTVPSIVGTLTSPLYDVYSGAPNQTTTLCTTNTNCIEGYVLSNSDHNNNSLLKFSQTLINLSTSASYSTQLRQLLSPAALDTLVMQSLQPFANFTWSGNQCVAQSSVWNEVVVSFNTTNQLSFAAVKALTTRFNTLLGSDEDTVQGEANTGWVIPVSTILAFLFALFCCYCCYTRWLKHKLNCGDCGCDDCSCCYCLGQCAK